MRGPVCRRASSKIDAICPGISGACPLNYNLNCTRCTDDEEAGNHTECGDQNIQSGLRRLKRSPVREAHGLQLSSGGARRRSSPNQRLSKHELQTALLLFGHFCVAHQAANSSLPFFSLHLVQVHMCTFDGVLSKQALQMAWSLRGLLFPLQYLANSSMPFFSLHLVQVHFV